MKMIYKDFKKITEKDEWFYSSIQEVECMNWKIYEIESFSYRMVPWIWFQDNPLKKEMRWISFIKEKWTMNEPKLFTIGFHKFFNYWEGEGFNSTIEMLKRENIDAIVDKIDWSLMMFWMLPTWEILAKSKTSINSNVSDFANKFIQKNHNYEQLIRHNLENWYFPIFEYVWPDNRIVLPYEKSELILLGVRYNDLTYMSYKELNNMANYYNVKIAEKKEITLNEVFEKKEKDSWYEWFILELENHERIKIKLNSYINLHATKDNINNRKKLIELALNEDLDDLRWLFIEDELTLKIINEVEKEVFSTLNHIISEVEKIHNETKHLEIKDYAILHKNNDYFSLLMQKYKSFEPEYKKFTFNLLK